MSTNGWIFMLVSFGLITGLVTYCFYHIFFKDRKTDKGK